MFDQKDNLITSQIASSLLVQQMIEPEKLKGKNDYENKTEDNGNNGRWEKSEHLRFLAGCLLYKNNWKKVETYVRTRTSTQIRSHAQKYLKKLEKKYFPKNYKNSSPNDSLLDADTNNDLNRKDNINNNNIKDININNDIINKEKNEQSLKEEVKENNNNMELDEINDKDNIFKLSEEKINELVQDLKKENFNVEIVEKIIINIFRPNKKCEDSPKHDFIIRKSSSKNNNSKNNKNIFLCQKLKREINYEVKMKELLNSNNQNDLQYLFKIYREKTPHLFNILLNQIENN